MLEWWFSESPCITGLPTKTDNNDWKGIKLLTVLPFTLFSQVQLCRSVFILWGCTRWCLRSECSHFLQGDCALTRSMWKYTIFLFTLSACESPWNNPAHKRSSECDHLRPDSSTWTCLKQNPCSINTAAILINNVISHHFWPIYLLSEWNSSKSFKMRVY